MSDVNASLHAIPGLADLAGFDLVYAITQDAINEQLQELFVMVDGGLPSTWEATTPKKTATIAATLGVPSVSLAAGASTGTQVVMSVPLVSGTYTGYAMSMGDDGPVVTKETTDLTGSTLRLTSSLNLAGVAAGGTNVPAEVQKQLSQFDSSMLDVQHLFLDLEDANLLSSAELDTGGRLDDEPNTLESIAALIKSLLDSLKGSGNPYVFGYVATDKQPDPADPTWSPTGMTYSLFADSGAVGRSTVNSLLVVGGRSVPGGGAGQFTTNLVTRDDVKGAFVISAQLMMTPICNSVGAAIGQSPSIFQVQVDGSLVGSFGNDIGGTTTVNLQPQVGTNQLVMSFHSTFRKDVEDRAGSGIGYVDGTIDQTGTLTFDVDDNGVIRGSVVVSDPVTNHESHPNFLGKLEEVLAIFADAVVSIVSLGFAPNVFENLVNDDWSATVVDSTLSSAGTLSTRLVPPAGGELFFKDARFLTGGAMALDTSIRN